MSRNNNENGYALLLVLLLVTIIMIVSASFVTASVSNAKQEKTMDTNNMAVVAAEMGVDYYKNALTNKFNMEKEGLMNYAQEEINKIIDNNEEITQYLDLDEIHKNIVGKLKDILQLEIDNLSGEKIVNNSVGFSENLNLPSIQTSEVKVEGPVIGRSEENNKKELTFDITFKVPKLKLDGSGGGGEGAIDMYLLYPNPTGLPDCEGNLRGKECMGKDDTSLEDMNDSTVYFNGDYKDKSKNNNNLKNLNGSKIYIKGNFDAKNMNSLNNVSFL